MPRERKRRPDLFQTWIDSNPDFYADLRINENENDLFCTFCGTSINSADKSRVTRHVKSHASSSSNDRRFFYDLTKAFIASDIPLYKLENPVLRTFLKKYTGRKIPHCSTLRITYLNYVYNDVVRRIREDIGDNFVYFIVDEATDACGRIVANFLIGTLQSDSASVSRLLASKVLEKNNDETIVRFVNECFNYLWPNKQNSDKVLVMLSDAKPYMTKAGKTLSNKYSCMVHFTCVVHALRRAAETVQDSFPLVDKLISSTKKIFFETPMKKNYFNETLGLTWLLSEKDTWLTAVAYYDEHFENTKAVIDSLDCSEVGLAQELMKNQRIREDIRYINSNYSVLNTAIQKLEKHGLSLSNQFKILHDVQDKIQTVPKSSSNVTMQEKLLDIFQKNPGYNILENISNYLNGAYQELPSNIERYKSCISYFKYCPLSSVDVEQSFSMHKLILRDQRRNLTADNLEKILVIVYEYRCTEDDPSSS